MGKSYTKLLLKITYFSTLYARSHAVIILSSYSHYFSFVSLTHSYCHLIIFESLQIHFLFIYFRNTNLIDIGKKSKDLEETVRA